MATKALVAILCLAITAVCANQNAVNYERGNKLNDGNVKKVHVIFMNHLDVGYAGYINDVVNTYFTNYFPQAAALGKQMAEGGFVEKFTYTTHPWLISLYLDCPPNLVLAGVKMKCPNATEIKDFKEAVKSGVIAWHAGPMNMQIEIMDEAMLKMGIQLGYSLDKKFNITRPFAVLSQRDVPGITQAAIPILRKMGVKAVSVGVNNGSSPPAVPKVFRWQFNGTEVMATWHPGGYPDNPGNPAHPGGLSYHDCATVPGFSEAMCYSFRTDNSGPPKTVQEVLGSFEILRRQFPGAEIQASTFDKFFIALDKSSANLPVVTQELGDTWIQGIGSDPRKVADMRAVSRVLGNCINEGQCRMDDERVSNATRFLVKMAEHTWGVSSPGDTVHWTNEDFAPVRKMSNFKRCEASWREQRVFAFLTVEALADHPIAKEVKKELVASLPKRPNLRGFSSVPLFTDFKCSSKTSFRFDGSGSIVDFVLEGVRIANKTNPFGKFIYQTFDETDIDNFSRVYQYGNWNPGFTKANMTANARPEHFIWPTVMNQVYQNEANPCDVYIHVTMVDKKPTMYYGAPQDVWIRYTYNSMGSAGMPEVDIDFQFFGKVTTRLPEALYYSIEPPTSSSSKWMMSKLGQAVDPMNVILNGSQLSHAVGAISYMDGGQGFVVNSFDASLVTVMTSALPDITVYPSHLVPLKDVTGMAFNLYNNAWGTNYIYWYPFEEADEDFRARFTVIPITKQKMRMAEVRIN